MTKLQTATMEELIAEIERRCITFVGVGLRCEESGEAWYIGMKGSHIILKAAIQKLDRAGGSQTGTTGRGRRRRRPKSVENPVKELARTRMAWFRSYMGAIDLQDTDEASMAADVLAKLGIPVSPPMSVCPRDYRLASISELMREIQRRSIGVILVSVGPAQGPDTEDWSTNLYGTNAMLIGMCHRIEEEMHTLRKQRKRGFE